jgi:hypothetical protein
VNGFIQIAVWIGQLHQRLVDLLQRNALDPR